MSEEQAPSAAASTEDFGSTMQLLALCPLLAVSDTVVRALGLGVAVLVVVPLATLLAACTRRWWENASALATAMLLVAAIVAVVELLMRAWFHALHDSLGVFVPLIVANLAIVDGVMEPGGAGRGFQWRPVRRSLKLAAGIALTLLALGIARELVGRGSLLHDAGLMLAPALGAWTNQLETRVFRVDMGFLLAMLPPGAFISLGLLIAAGNWIRSRRSEA